MQQQYMWISQAARKRKHTLSRFNYLLYAKRASTEGVDEARAGAPLIIIIISRDRVLLGWMGGFALNGITLGQLALGTVFCVATRRPSAPPLPKLRCRWRSWALSFLSWKAITMKSWNFSRQGVVLKLKIQKCNFVCLNASFYFPVAISYNFIHLIFRSDFGRVTSL